MRIVETPIADLLILEPRVHKDARGSFQEAFNARAFEEVVGFCPAFVQENQSVSKQNVIRGLHFQTGTSAQAKLVRATSGTIMDVAVDLRPNSPSFGQHYKATLSSENHHIMYIPKGMAHGFLALSNSATVVYLCDAFYDPQREAGLSFDDPDLGIDWGIDLQKAIVSDKDRNWPTFKAWQNA